MRRALLYRYRLALDAGVVLRDRRLPCREGLLVRLVSGDRQGWGEIAPLAGFSAESLDEAQVKAINELKRWCEHGYTRDDCAPSVAFGVSCALAELQGSLPEAGTYQGALLCNGDPDTLFQRLSGPAPLAKMKVGLYEAVRDGMQVSLLLEALPQLTLRLDANRSWHLEKALQFARYVPVPLRSRIAYLEEPCRTREESLSFARQTGIALAWDETLRETELPLRAEPGVTAVIIKPTLSGSIRQVQQQVAQARLAGLTPVIGSALESSLGLTQLARLARWLTPDVAPGLDTLALMQQQLLRRWPGCELPLQAEEALQCLWHS